MPLFTRTSELPFSAGEVFAWHGRPGALERLTPPWENVRVLEREGGLEVGARIRILVRQGPVRFVWELTHTAYEEGRLFRDEQVSGPFRKWRHSHHFEPAGADRCIMRDEVEWELPLGGIAGIGDAVVRRSLDRLFTFRHRRLANDLTLHARAAARLRKPALTVAITGSSGLIGRNLTHFLTSGGHAVKPLVRSRKGAEETGGIYWSVARKEIEGEKLEGLDAAVHLAGEPLVALRWTDGKKRAILESRVDGTRLLSRTLAELGSPPDVLVSASGINYYDDHGEQVVTEETPAGDGFLSRVCQAWESAADSARERGIRVVHPRSGVVLSPAGGALGTMLVPFKLGVAGRLGSGAQYFPWIDIDDEVGLLHHALVTEATAGPMNFTAPNPVTNAAFTRTLGRVLGRPTLLPLPAIAIRSMMGEMGDAMLLEGVRAIPRHAEETGYRFLFDRLEASLRHQLGREAASGTG